MDSCTYGAVERAIIYTYDINTGWSKTATTAQLASEPFSEGSMRRAYYGKVTVDGHTEPYVVKLCKNAGAPRQGYFKDVEMQSIAQKWAQNFSTAYPPKPISFVSAYVLELVDRPGRPVCSIEKPIVGKFIKHNNNVGAVRQYHQGDAEEEAAHMIAQGFSHYSFEMSGHQLLICDIQGVGLMYTDPQIHSASGVGFGEGNLGITGMRAFLLRHKCNYVCAKLQLPLIEAKTFSSTIPPAHLAHLTQSSLRMDNVPLAGSLGRSSMKDMVPGGNPGQARTKSDCQLSPSPSQQALSSRVHSSSSSSDLPASSSSSSSSQSSARSLAYSASTTSVGLRKPSILASPPFSSRTASPPTTTCSSSSQDKGLRQGSLANIPMPDLDSSADLDALPSPSVSPSHNRKASGLDMGGAVEGKSAGTGDANSRSGGGGGVCASEKEDKEKEHKDSSRKPPAKRQESQATLDEVDEKLMAAILATTSSAPSSPAPAPSPDRKTK